VPLTLSTEGYETAAFTSGTVLMHSYRLDQGFATYDDSSGIERPATGSADSAVPEILLGDRGCPIGQGLHPGGR